MTCGNDTAPSGNSTIDGGERVEPPNNCYAKNCGTSVDCLGRSSDWSDLTTNGYFKKSPSTTGINDSVAGTVFEEAVVNAEKSSDCPVEELLRMKTHA